MSAGTMLSPGFADPALDAQAVFRRVLDAMAHPGRIVTLDDGLPHAPAPLGEAAFAVALTLLDFETPVWLDKALETEGVIESLRFHCGCPITDQPETAAFALIGDAGQMPVFADFGQGTPEYPDRGATLVIQTDGQTGGLSEEGEMILRGPGIEDLCHLGVAGLPADFEERWQGNRARSPNGVDLILTHGRRLACLPRTTSLER